MTLPYFFTLHYYLLLLFAFPIGEGFFVSKHPKPLKFHRIKNVSD